MADLITPDPSDEQVSGQQFATNVPGPQGYIPVSNGDGTFTWTSPSGAGAQGPQGATGAQGPQGHQGAQGAQGATG